MKVSRELQKIKEEQPDLKVEEIDVVSNPVQSWKAGVRMIPTLTCDNQKLSGVFLSSKQIRDFLATV